jgi:hypothetical protein
MSKMDSAICPRVGIILIEDRKNNVGRAPEVRYIFFPLMTKDSKLNAISWLLIILLRSTPDFILYLLSINLIPRNAAG